MQNKIRAKVNNSKYAEIGLTLAVGAMASANIEAYFDQVNPSTMGATPLSQYPLMQSILMNNTVGMNAGLGLSFAVQLVEKFKKNRFSLTCRSMVFSTLCSLAFSLPDISISQWHAVLGFVANGVLFLTAYDNLFSNFEWSEKGLTSTILGIKNSRSFSSIVARNILGIFVASGLISYPTDGAFALSDTFDIPLEAAYGIMALPGFMFILFAVNTARDTPEKIQESYNILQQKIGSYLSIILIMFIYIAASLSCASVLNINNITFSEFNFILFEERISIGIIRDLSPIDLCSMLESTTLFNGTQVLHLVTKMIDIIITQPNNDNDHNNDDSHTLPTTTSVNSNPQARKTPCDWVSECISNCWGALWRNTSKSDDATEELLDSSQKKM